MIKKIIAFSLNSRQLMLVAAVCIAVWSAILASNMSIDVLPNLNRPTVTVMTEAHAMVPEDVEQLITTPLEQILNGMTGVIRVRSSSGLGLSVIKVEFEWDTDVYRNRQIVAEKLALAKSRLPDGSEPQMTPISSIMGQVQLIGLSSKSGETKVQALRELADFKIKYELMTVPGVSKVIVAGGAQKQLQVIIDPEKLRAYNVSVNEVALAIEKSNINSSGGFINSGSTAPVITLTGRLNGYSDLMDAVIMPAIGKTRPVRIKDVATVMFGPSTIKIGEAGVNGQNGVILVVMKQPGFDTVKLSEDLEKKLSVIQRSFDTDIEVTPGLFKQADFINRAISNVMEAVRDGSIMVVFILFLFLMNWRTTVVTLATIPLSLAVIVIIFELLGMNINTMTLGGLAVAVGALVDDAIVDVENSFRRLKQNALLPLAQQKARYIVIFESFSEVIKPIVVGTALVLAGFIPLFFLDGLEGKLFIPIGLTYILGVVCSLLVSMTVTPALCYYLLDPNKMKNSKEPVLVIYLKKTVGKLILLSINHAKKVLFSLAILTVLSLIALMSTGTQFLPEFNEGVVQINLVLPPESSLEVSDNYGKRLEKLLMQVEGVSYVARRTGRSEGDEHAEGVNVSEAIVNFDQNSHRSREEMIKDIREVVDQNFPGVAYAVDQPLAHLLSSMLSGVQAQVAIKVFGQDLQELRRIAKEIKETITPVDGVKDLMIEQQVLIPNVEIVPKREQLARYGLTVADVSETVELSLGSEPLSRMIKGRFYYPIVMRLGDEAKSSLEALKRLYIRCDNGDLIKLKEVADVRLSLTTNNIKHENVGRRIVVQHNVAGRALGDVVVDVQKALQPLQTKLQEDGAYYFTIGGQFEAQQSASRRIMFFSLITLVVMVIILYLHFRSFNITLQVIGGIPMSLIGAVIFIKLTGQSISIATMVGLIALGGIAARNAILLLDHYIDLVKDESYEFSKEMIIKAGQERMSPVLMTALTSGIGLIPLVLSPGAPGKEILYPIATVIVGGLLSSTLLDFIARPAAFFLFSKGAIKRSIARTSSKNEKITVDSIEQKITKSFES